MARRKGPEGSVAGYFRPLFQDHPEWLKGKSNAAILARYRADHGLGENAEVPLKIKQNLANLKSVLRKKLRRRGRPKGSVSAMNAAPAAVAPRRFPVSKLETLEEMIDDCLTLARNQDREGLHKVIQLLRHARNAVVWKMGE